MCEPNNGPVLCGQEECSKWGRVERLVIYNERQSEDDDPAHANVKIFVQFAEPDGTSHLHFSLLEYPACMIEKNTGIVVAFRRLVTNNGCY